MSSADTPETTRKSQPTEDEKLLNVPVDAETLRIRRNSDSWRVLRIMGEFTWGFENLQDVAGGVSVFGSARTKPGDPYYQAAERVGRLGVNPCGQHQEQEQERSHGGLNATGCPGPWPQSGGPQDRCP